MTRTSPDQVSKYHFHLDTCATAHMCPYPERFEHLDICTVILNSSSGEAMAVKGKGTVILRCRLTDGDISIFRLDDVLYVPNLELPLFSWRKERNKGYTLHDDGQVMRLLKANKIWLEAHFNGPLLVIPEVTPALHQMACTTHEFWHEALCHSAPSSISKQKDLFRILK